MTEPAPMVVTQAGSDRWALGIHSGTTSRPQLIVATKAQLPGAVAHFASELRTAASSPRRWVWHRTDQVYPALVAAGARGERCVDLTHGEQLIRALHGPSAAATPANPADSADLPGVNDSSDQASLFDAFWPGRPNTVTDPVTAWQEVSARYQRYQAEVSAAATHHPSLPLLLAADYAGRMAAIEMSVTGLPWHVPTHEAILQRELGEPRPGARPARLQTMADELAKTLQSPGLNPDSPAELLAALRRIGLPVTSTSRWELNRIDHPVVALVRQYKSAARLWTAHGWSWRDIWVRAGRFHPHYVAAGTASGRWTTTGGGALQIPVLLRPAVRAEPGRVLVIADAAQAEPRVLAAISGDPGMIAATRGADLYTDLAEQAGLADRNAAKVAVLSAMYGGQSPALPTFRQHFTAAYALVEAAAATGRAGGSVQTALGRVCTQPPDDWLAGLTNEQARSQIRARGRYTRNFLVQGSAADWAAVLIAEIRRRINDIRTRTHAGGGFAELVFFQHDEVMVEADTELAEAVIDAVAAAGHTATRLVFGDCGVIIPLVARAVEHYDAKAADPRQSSLA